MVATTTMRLPLKGKESGAIHFMISTFELPAAADRGWDSDGAIAVLDTCQSAPQPFHRRLGIVSSTRASAHLYTNEDEVDALLEPVADTKQFFGANE